MIHPSIKILEKSNIAGKGLVASAPIRHGEVVWQLDPSDPIVHLPEIAQWPAQKQEDFAHFAFQLDDEDFVIPQGIDRYTNHSCDPNTWWSDNRTFVARKDIQAGEEVTYDYSTADILLDFQMVCHCGSNECRKMVTNRDYLNPAWQKKYSNHLPGHLLRAIEKGKQEEGNQD